MYGMVNEALEQLVVETFGEPVWQKVKRRAGVSDPAFIRMKEYPDQMTYALAGALSQEVGVPLSQLLHAFGVYWVGYAKKGPWGKIMLASGANTYELLSALDAMHARIAISFPELRPPSFKTARHGDAMRVEYHSHRPALAPFVIGLMEGIGNLFGERVAVVHEHARDAGAPHDVFLVTAAPATD